jgi:hypothetical protein
MVPDVEDHFVPCVFRSNRTKSTAARIKAAVTFTVEAQSMLKVRSLCLLVFGNLGLSRTDLIVVDVTKTITFKNPGYGVNERNEDVSPVNLGAIAVDSSCRAPQVSSRLQKKS